MKKATAAFAIGLLLCLSHSAFSQYILKEDFQQGIPSTWTVIDVDGRAVDSILPLPSIITDAWVSLNDVGSPGDSFAASTSKYLPTGQANDWLISPAIVTGSSSALIWYANAFIPSGDGYEVRISTTTPTVNAFLANPALFTIATENVGWTKRSANLAAYPNQTVYLAFRNNSTDKYILGIDDIAVFDCGTIAADAGDIGTGTVTACAGFPSLNLELEPSFSTGAPTNTISGNTNDIPNWAPLAGRPFEDGGCCNFPTNNPPYQLIEFQVTVSGNYTIVQTQTGYDGVIYLYTDPLDLTIDFPEPTTFVDGNDDEVPDRGPGISELLGVPLTTGVNYYLISTGYETADRGVYTTTFTGPGLLIVQSPGAANSPFDYDFVVSNSNGVIVSTGDDLTNTTAFPGSVAGDTFTVCGISHINASLNLTNFINTPYSSLVNAVNGNSCAELTNTCHTVIIKSGGTVDAGRGDTVCAGTPVFLTASGGTSYQWSTTDTTANIEVIPFHTTTYGVTAVDNIGCSATDNVTVKVFASDGGKFRNEDLKACEGEADLNLSPNPEFTKNFLNMGSNIISGNTVNYTTWDPLPGRPFADGTCCSGNNVVFDVKPFQVTATGRYTFNQTQAGYDGMMFLYTEPFDIYSNPPVTFIVGNDDGTGGPNTSTFDTILQASTTYFLVSTGVTAVQFGNYITSISGPGNVLLPVAPDSTEFGYEYAVVENGIITEFTKDLSDSIDFPGSLTGTDYQVCAVSYLSDSININLYLNQPYANLSGVTCLDPSANCIKVTIFTHPVANAGPDDSICFNTPYILAADTPAFGSGTWSTLSGNASFFNFRDPHTLAILDTGLNVLTWTINNGGCTDVDTVRILVTQPTIDAGVGDTICFGESTTLTASGGGPYAWSTGDSTASAIVTPDESTTYIVFTTAPNGCSGSDTVRVIVNPLPIVDVPDASICPGSTTILDAGHPGSTYRWSTNATTQTIAVTDGVYSVTLTDTNGCVNADTATVIIGTGLTVVLNDITQCDGDTAVLNAGNPGSSYIWSTGDTTQTIEVTLDGTYSVTVADANNCTGGDSAVITLLPLPALIVSNDDTICSGESVTLTATGAGTFRWSTADSISTITVSPTQDETYSVTLTGGNGCSISQDIAITVGPAPNADAGPDANMCIGDSLTLAASGGASFAWSTGATTAIINISPVINTIYVVTVSTGSCSDVDSVSVTVLPAAVADAGTGDTLCSGESTTLTATGGGTYLWENGNANSTITITPSQSEYYSVTVTAANGCQASDSVLVLVNDAPSVNFGPVTDVCVGTTVTLTVTGADTYVWSTGATTASIDVTPTTNQLYSVTASTTFGCSTTDSTLVQVQNPPVANAGPDTTICEGSTIDLTASGGVDYHWSTGANINPLTVSPLSTTTYSVTVANAAGCEDVDEVTVTVNVVAQVTLFGFDDGDTVCIDDGPIVIAGDPTGGTLSGPGVSNGNFVPSVAGAGTHTITYTLTQPDGCVSSDSKVIIVEICDAIAGLGTLQIKIYPNPTENFVIVEAKGLHRDMIIRIFDVAGKLLLTENAATEKKVLDLSSLASGTYLLQLRSGNETMMHKIVKND